MRPLLLRAASYHSARQSSSSTADVPWLASHTSPDKHLFQLLTSHLQVASINIARTSISRTQNSLNIDRTRDLLREANTLPASTGTSVAVLLEHNIRSTSITGVPNVPARAIDDISHARALEDNTRESSPRTTEEVRASGHRVPRSGGDGGLVDHIVSSVVGSAAGSGDVALGGREDADVDLLEPSLGVLAEDEIGGTLDVRLCVELGAVLREDGVLVAVEAAGVVALCARVGGEGEGLGAFAVGVLDVDVVCVR